MVEARIAGQPATALALSLTQDDFVSRLGSRRSRLMLLVAMLGGFAFVLAIALTLGGNPNDGLLGTASSSSSGASSQPVTAAAGGGSAVATSLQENFASSCQRLGYQGRCGCMFAFMQGHAPAYRLVMDVEAISKDPVPAMPQDVVDALTACR